MHTTYIYSYLLHIVPFHFTSYIAEISFGPFGKCCTVAQSVSDMSSQLTSYFLHFSKSTSFYIIRRTSVYEASVLSLRTIVIAARYEDG